MEAMAWWLIPIVATLLAVAWVTWRARPPPSGGPPRVAGGAPPVHRGAEPPGGPAGGASDDRTRPRRTDDLPTQHRRSA